jgi:hypothetical protein
MSTQIQHPAQEGRRSAGTQQEGLVLNKKGWYSTRRAGTLVLNKTAVAQNRPNNRTCLLETVVALAPTEMKDEGARVLGDA